MCTCSLLAQASPAVARPRRYFCNEGVNAPTKCNLLSDCHCEGGCAEPHNYMSIPVLVRLSRTTCGRPLLRQPWRAHWPYTHHACMRTAHQVLVPLGLWLGFWLFQYYNHKRLARRDRRHAHMREMMRIKRKARKLAGGRGRAGTGYSLDLSDTGSVSPSSAPMRGGSIELGIMTTPGLNKNLLSRACDERGRALGRCGAVRCMVDLVVLSTHHPLCRFPTHRALLCSHQLRRRRVQARGWRCHRRRVPATGRSDQLRHVCVRRGTACKGTVCVPPQAPVRTCLPQVPRSLACTWLYAGVGR